MQNIDCRFSVYGDRPHINHESPSSRKSYFDAPVRTQFPGPLERSRWHTTQFYQRPPHDRLPRSMPLSSLTGAGLTSCYSISSQFATPRIAEPHPVVEKAVGLETDDWSIHLLMKVAPAKRMSSQQYILILRNRSYLRRFPHCELARFLTTVRPSSITLD